MNLRREGNEQVKAITLRSGKELEVPGPSQVTREVENKEVTQTSQDDKMEREQP